MRDQPTTGDLAQIMALTARSRPQDACAAIDALAKRLFDHRLFTVTRSILDTQEVQRVYSSNETAYPVGGRKQKHNTPWGEQVLDRGEILVCDDADDIRRVFPATGPPESPVAVFRVPDRMASRNYPSGPPIALFMIGLAAAR
jgi:hypothetical protein